MAEQLSIEISAKDLTGQAFAAVQQQLAEINGASQATAKGMGELSEGAGKAAALIKGGGIGAVISHAVNELAKYHDATKKAVGGLVDQADALGISTDRLQAYTFAANNVGISQEQMSAALQRFTIRLGDAVAGKKSAIEAFDKLGVKILDSNGKLRDEGTILAEAARAILNLSDHAERAAASKNLMAIAGSKVIPVLYELSKGSEELERRARDAGVMIDQELAEKINKANNQASLATLQIRKLYAEIALPIEIGALNAVANGVARLNTNIAESRGNWMTLIALIANPGLTIGALTFMPTSLEATQGALDAKRKEVEGYQKSLNGGDLGARGQAAQRQRLDKARGELADLERQADVARVSGRSSYSAIDPDGVGISVSAGGGAKSPKPTKTGSGGANQDRIQQAINQLQLETLAANDAVAKLMAGSGVPLKELERSIALEKKIQDEIAKLGKYDPKDPRVAQIRQLVTEHERAEAAYRKTAAAAKDADDIERRMGDGTAFLRVETERLNEAQRTGRLNTETYAVAMKDAADKAEDMRLKFQGAEGGVEGLIAGMQNAAAQWERSNRSFARGGKLFDSLMSNMDQAIAGLASGAELNFGKMAQAFFVSMAQMEARAAASSLFKLLPGGSISGLIGSIFSGGEPDINALNQQAINNIAGGAPGLAGGGVSPVNTPFWVGENGPELMSFDRPSRVINRDQMAGMGSDGGVSINQTMYFGSDVTQASLRDWAMRTKNETIAAVIDARRRGGSMKQAFA